MKVKTLTLSLSVKRSLNYQSVDYTEAVEVELSENENPMQVRQILLERLSERVHATANAEIEKLTTPQPQRIPDRSIKPEPGREA